MIHRNRPQPLLFAAALLLAGGLAACSDRSSTAPIRAETDPIEQLAAMGFDRSQIVDRGDHYVVERDIRVDKKDLRASAGPDFHRVVGTVSAGQRTINVDLSAVDAVSASWGSATRAAMANWNAVPSAGIYFQEASPAEITVSFVGSQGYCGAALGAWPSYGAPGPTVTINQQFVSSYSYGQQVWIMTHELGHNVGLAHHQQTMYPLIPGTPSSDAASVMNEGGFYGNTCPLNLPAWSAFSSGDQLALRTLYGLPYPQNLLSRPYEGTVQVSWSPVADALYYEYQRYEWSTHSWGGASYNPFGWNATYATSFITGYDYTGQSECTFTDNGPNPNTDYFQYQVRAVFPGGKRSITLAVGAQDGYC